MSLNDEELSQGLAIAYDLFRRGSLEDVQILCERLLREKGDHPDLLTLLGMALTQNGNLDFAIVQFKKSVQIAPDVARYHNNLGLALKRAGLTNEAKEAYRTALSIDSTYAQAHNNLGILALESRDFSEAILRFESALRSDPSSREAGKNLARALLDNGQFARSVEKYRSVLIQTPEDPDIFVSLSEALHLGGNTQTALLQLDSALDLSPNYVPALIKKGDLLKDLGNLTEACSLYRTVINISPSSAEAHDRLGLTLQAMGEIEGATACFQRAISENPKFAQVYRHLAFSRKFKVIDDDVLATQNFLKNNLSPDSEMHGSFAISKVYDDLERYDEAFEYLSRANELKRDTFEFNVNNDRRFFEQLKSTFIPDLFLDRREWALDDPAPIFVVGMPRSGTTLVEQILASHPRVFGAGEVLHLHRLLWHSQESQPSLEWCSKMSSLNKAELQDIASAYLEALRYPANSCDHITDKTPGNFHYIGMIGLMFSDAKIINCKRNPLDNCFSCYQNYFSQSVPFAYDLSELGIYYGLYEEIMSHWHMVMPNRIYDIQYEQLLENQETQTRRLLDHCGLEWDPSCLAFHLTPRPIWTASVTQVRQKLYRSSIGRAAHYGAHLDPLRIALGAPT